MLQARKPYDEAIISITNVLETVIEAGNNKCLNTTPYQILYNEIFKSCVGWKNFAGAPDVYTFIIDYIKQNISRANTYITFRAVYDILLFPRRNCHRLGYLLDRYEAIFKQREMTLLEHCYLAMKKSFDRCGSIKYGSIECGSIMSDIEYKIRHLQKNK